MRRHGRHCRASRRPRRAGRSRASMPMPATTRSAGTISPSASRTPSGDDSSPCRCRCDVDAVRAMLGLVEARRWARRRRGRAPGPAPPAGPTRGRAWSAPPPPPARYSRRRSPRRASPPAARPAAGRRRRGRGSCGRRSKPGAGQSRLRPCRPPPRSACRNRSCSPSVERHLFAAGFDRGHRLAEQQLDLRAPPRRRGGRISSRSNSFSPAR